VRRVIVSSALLVILAGMPMLSSPAWAIGGVRPTNPAAVALQLRDLPPGFAQLGGSFLTPAQVVKGDNLSASALTRHGEVKAFASTFARGGDTGMLYVADYVVSFKNSSDSHWFYQQLLAGMHHWSRWVRRHLHPIPTGYLGQERFGLIYNDEYNDMTVTATLTTFRRDIFVAQLFVYGGMSGFLPGQAVGVAQIIDQHMLISH
jgi:hypothetical protein